MAGRQPDQPITLVQKKYFSAFPECTCPLTDKDLENQFDLTGTTASKITTRAPRARAASCTVAFPVAVWATFARLTRTAIVEAGGIRLCISSKHFLNSSTFRLVTPVMLQSGALGSRRDQFRLDRYRQ